VESVVAEEERPPIPGDCPKRLKFLIESCWHTFPSHRPDFEDINNALDEIIIEAAISDRTASRFWLLYFLKEVQFLLFGQIGGD